MSQVYRRRQFLRPRIVFSVIGLIAIIVVVALGALAIQRARAAQAHPVNLTYPQRNTIIATINASGQIEPAAIANLSFTAPGRVSEVLVKVGDKVDKDAPLARLDSRELQAKVAQAEAAKLQAQANYDQLAAGATPQEIAAAEGQVNQAQGMLRQTQGSVTNDDVQAATRQMQQAQAQLQSLEAGPKDTDLRAAEAQLQQAQAQLTTQRDQLSANKTNAQSKVTQSA